MNMHELMRRRNRKKAIYLAIFFVLIIVSILISVSLGQISLSPGQVIRTLFGNGNGQENLILFQMRMPRIVMAVLVGMGLAVSGCILQALTRNELADPGILGINNGAGIMIVVYLLFFQSESIQHLLALPFAAFIGSALTAVLLYLFSYRKNEGIDPSRLVLVGIGLSAAIAGVMIMFTIRLRPDEFQFMAKWLSGNIWGKTWDYVIVLLPWLIVLLPLSFVKARVLDALSFGKDLSSGLGVAVGKERILLLIFATALAASCVSVSGSIGFAGLIAPHLARRLVGTNHRYLLPASALVGALLVLNSDTIARMILQPSGIPTGIVVAVVGAPYFIYLLAKSRV
ncbi:FecCD family ABC transporter permease [Bacillus testis]|uniref:FecCD family ABC transporter permease n=1 Tax=Bacillus testis TaxID=1622072 RepID=UPI00067F0D80|nr:iron ABC transporter permease [Bacillus testis]